MKKRPLRLFLKKFTYISGDVKIKSDVELTNQQVKDVCSIIRQTMNTAYYDKGFHIARRIVYALGAPVCFTECRLAREKVYIKISQYHRSRAFK